MILYGIIICNRKNTLLNSLNCPTKIKNLLKYKKINIFFHFNITNEIILIFYNIIFKFRIKLIIFYYN